MRVFLLLCYNTERRAMTMSREQSSKSSLEYHTRSLRLYKSTGRVVEKIVAKVDCGDDDAFRNTDLHSRAYENTKYLRRLRAFRRTHAPRFRCLFVTIIN